MIIRNSERGLHVILVDTSVFIDFLRGKDTVMTQTLDEICELGLPVGFSAFTYMELLQGVKDEFEFETLRRDLCSYPIYYIEESEEKYRNIARMYFNLRRKGVTPRNSIDLMIVATAIEYDMYLLHDDRDYDQIAPFFPKLKIWPKKVM